MVNSISLYGNHNVNSSDLYSKTKNGGFQNNFGLDSVFSTQSSDCGIMPQNKKTVTVNGETYEVKTVQDHNPMVSTFAPTYKEVVVIDGKQYDVKTVSNPLVCDGTKQVVNIDGEVYDVNQKNGLDILV